MIVICEKCRKQLSTPRSRGPVNYSICQKCKDQSFNESQFCLVHLGLNKWIVEDDLHNTWCGSHGWVSLQSSYHAVTPDCQPIIFTWEEVKEFLKDKFECEIS